MTLWHPIVSVRVCYCRSLMQMSWSTRGAIGRFLSNKVPHWNPQTLKDLFGLVWWNLPGRLKCNQDFCWLSCAGSKWPISSTAFLFFFFFFSRSKINQSLPRPPLRFYHSVLLPEYLLYIWGSVEEACPWRKLALQIFCGVRVSIIGNNFRCQPIAVSWPTP